MKNIVKKADIVLTVGLDAENIPTTIEWTGENSESAKPCKAVLLSLFDSEYKDTYKIDLWTTEMQVQEMDRLMYQTLRGLADTYFKATNNKELANQMQRFAQFFAEETKILSPSE